MANASVFGEIPGSPVGTLFLSREAVRQAGLHRHVQAGISGSYDDGADAIIVSGGYVDDSDEGDRIVYTGQGGQDPKTKKQVTDQQLTRGNLALARSEASGTPVRVIRGAGGNPEHSPGFGYRYDGMFTVVEHWQERSIDGPLVWRYVLEKSDGGSAWQSATSGAPPAGTKTPGRAVSTVQRVIRTSAVVEWVKTHHEHVCQFCGNVLETNAGRYAEGAHVRALGSPHNGPDEVSNVLCLCPNDHVLFDKGALYVDAGAVYRSSDNTPTFSLRTVDGHTIDPAHFAYHREHFAGVE